MIAHAAFMDSAMRDRLLLVAPGCLDKRLPGVVAQRFPDWEVSTCDTYLSAIGDVIRQPARAVLACVDASLAHLPDAVAGLREAIGKKQRLILCCTPENEPLARSVQEHGANDYILYPFQRDELNQALGNVPVTPIKSDPPPASFEELQLLGEALANIAERPLQLVEKIAALVQLALNATGATVVVQGSSASAGQPVPKPVLWAPIRDGVQVVGQLLLGEKVTGPYSAADVHKLEHYATIVGHLLLAAAKQRQWKQLAVTDECSGLPNRRFLNERLTEILSRAAKDRFPVTLLFFDIDDFKSYNDQYGHDAGDAILRSTGQLFRHLCREQDIVARYGGDEFAVVFWDPHGPRVPGSKHPDCALIVLERVREALQTEKIDALGAAGQGRLTISGGLATYPWDASTLDQLLSRADHALLAAKRAGKDRVFLVGDRSETAEPESP